MTTLPADDHRLLRDDGAVPVELKPRLAVLGSKLLLGTDFPDIAYAYAYAHQLEVLLRLDLGDDWLRRVCWSNAVSLFGLGNS